MTKLSSLTYPAGTPTLPTFISTQRADGILISITLIEIGFFTVASEEQFPNPARGVAAKKNKNDRVREIRSTEFGICETMKL